jgi:hypothetical protein
MANSFFDWTPSPASTASKILPWIGAVISSIFSFVPLLTPLRFVSATAQAAGAFVNGGLVTIAATTNDPEIHYLGTMQDLGNTFKEINDNMTKGLDTWLQTLYAGDQDSAGNTILDYFAGGRFTLDLNLSIPQLSNFYFQNQVSHVVNDQWSSPVAERSTFVMCTNGTARCNETSLYKENGRTCCLYSLTRDGHYKEPSGLDQLGNSTFNINASV